ncbi:hypothetical protein HanRHA438_Chr09g0389571 [Helianthus annuus]|uniref:Uncharacterized protein n=1 Tax=Helianthus annuus TaxID=4232 RepID=A0A9K3I5D2_HELAN|nr:hypothetical protein HanXRQr2_Chr09g0378131 [Helianthus annuus]KAJ0525289.1 hypothetical protein HanHA300_Chr09g0310321 [Helianthus annuus]KAJ0541665.1 hypothetical protein HanHA89_Chr09g0331101 [Helianthus annuus]KAJ0706740.1 hypothetical protein HanLR1_Chr09g0310541 [Helianthus annuus]KAJ0710773.1 hypothetical protein HanOQP8_Chr09g0316241 [Helianthus annuus]
MLMLISGQVVGFGRSVAESTLTPSISDFMMWHDTREATENEIDVLLMTLMPKFFRELGISLD